MRFGIMAVCILGGLLQGGCGQEISQGDEPEATVRSLTENSDRLDGLLTLFVDRDDGTVRALIRPDQFGRELIYVSTFQDAPVAAGLGRGWGSKNSILVLRRHFNRVDFVQPNTAFYFDPDNALSRAADANISPAVLASAEILAEDDSDGVLIDLGPVLLNESFTQIKPSPDPEAGEEPVFELGSLSESKTRFARVQSYPKNTELLVEYVFENPAPIVPGGDEIADLRYVTVSLQHSFIEAPADNYPTRRYDPRVGYFVNRITDLTSTAAAPWRDVIQRWRLVKKDPAAELSDPVAPVVFWIENTTPVEFRETVAEAVLGWNQAFEQAGFRNALQVRVQPDDADWDAGDIRYNVLRWTSSPTPAFGGMANWQWDPRTGEILGADIMLEYSYMTRRMRLGPAYGILDPDSPSRDGRIFCSLGARRQQDTLFGHAALREAGASPEDEAELFRQTLIELVQHEVGHTLGLNHNFIASHLYDSEALYAGAGATGGDVTASVMEYAAINLAPDGSGGGLYFQTRPGVYDRWAIQYGYSRGLPDPEAEEARLETLLGRSVERGLRFGNDGDDMRSVGAGIDPRIMIEDLASDAVSYSADRIRLIRHLNEGLVSTYGSDGRSWQDLLMVYNGLRRQRSNMVATVSRFIGGVRVDRSVQGQAGAEDPYRPVPLAEQRHAMEVLRSQVFAPDAYDAPGSLYQHLQEQRRDFDFYGRTEDPKIHEQVLADQSLALDHLLHPVVLKRLTDTALYGNEYRVSDMMSDLTSAVFDADMGGDVNAFRQNLQLEYVSRLVAMMAPDNAGGYDQPSRAMAVYTLQDLRRRLGAKTVGDVATKAHTAALLHSIDKALETA